MTGEHGRTWKPHQYLALLFTEHYLSRYFADPEQLRAELNEAKRLNRLTWPMPDYTPEDLRTIAFQSATGSGKTLIMHAHILQYRHRLHRAGKRINNVILVTPNEQMSAQHERDLRESGPHARIFSGDAGADLFAPIEYLLGCLLTFYQQCRIWRDKGALWADFNQAKPLWVFLGKTVTGQSKADAATRSDVVVILDFLGRFLGDGATVRAMLDRLLAGRSGLVDDVGGDYFAGRFGYLQGDRARSPDRLDHLARPDRPDQGDRLGRSDHPGDLDRPSRPADLYADICETLFHGQGRLHVVYLTAGEGELHLRVADGPVFGVVNVGNSAALHRMLTRSANPDLHVEREAGFAERLFAGVDRPDSTVNVVNRLFADGRSDWYELYAPPEKLDVTGFRQMRALEDIAVDLVTEYADQFWRKRRRQWEHERIEVVALTEDDPNIDDGGRSAESWSKDGVYFLSESDCLKQVVGHALETARPR